MSAEGCKFAPFPLAGVGKVWPVKPVTRPSASLSRIGSTYFALIIRVNSATSMSGCCSRSTLHTWSRVSSASLSAHP